jgi:hypothetical protein
MIMRYCADALPADAGMPASPSTACIGSDAPQGGMMEPASYCLITLVLCAAVIIGFAWRRLQAEESAHSDHSEAAQIELPQHATDRTTAGRDA